MVKKILFLVCVAAVVLHASSFVVTLVKFNRFNTSNIFWGSAFLFAAFALHTRKK